METKPSADDIARQNDALRAQLPRIAKPDMLEMTRGIAALPADDVAAIMEKVRTFDEFTPDSNPLEYRDYGSFEHGRGKAFWIISDHDGREGIRLVLTLMWEEER